MAMHYIEYHELMKIQKEIRDRLINEGYEDKKYIDKMVSKEIFEKFGDITTEQYF